MPSLSIPCSVLLLLFVAGPVGAQSTQAGTGMVSGVVRTWEGAPIPGASVALCRATDAHRLAGSTTDSTGAFRVTGVPSGSYRVEVRRIGYRMATRSGLTISSSGGRIDLGVVRLQRSAVALTKVAVTAARPAVAVLPDRTVYSTSGMPVAAGGTVTDVLRGIPELQVSMEGSVTLRGATPRIYIDGRPAPLQGESLDRYLQQLPAGRIDRVEVIANPSARYEADGQGGIVDIVMKRGAGPGLSGSVAIDAGTQNQQSGSGSLSVQAGKVSLFGSGSASVFRSRSRSSDLRQNLNVDPTTYIQQDSRSRNSGDMADVHVAAEVQVGSGGTLWADVGSGRNPSDARALAAYAYLDHLRQPTERYDRVNDTELRGRFGSSSIGYRRVTADAGNEWSVELRRSANVVDHADASTRLALNVDGSALDLPPELTFAGQGQDQSGLSLEANLTRRWGASGKVEAGYRGSLRMTGDDFRMSVDSSRNPGTAGATVGDFRQRERIDAVFVSGMRRIGRFAVQAGVRGEWADTRRALPLSDETFTSARADLFPSVAISTELGAGGQVSLSYTKRVDRPWGALVDPATPILDPLNRRIGNPYLLPRYTHSVSLTLARTGRVGMLQLSPYYRRTRDSWDQVRTVDTAGISTVTWRNLATVSSYGATLTGSLTPLGRIGGFLSLSGYREVRDASNLPQDFSGASTQLAVTGTVSVRATSALSLEGFLTYLPAHDVPQGRISPMVFSTLGMRRQLPGRRGTLTLSVVDPFQLQRFTFTTRDRTHAQLGSSTFSARRATLGVSYSFGRPLQRQRRSSRDEGRQDEDAPVIR